MILFVILILVILATAMIDASHIERGQHLSLKAHKERFFQRSTIFILIAYYDLTDAFAFAFLFMAMFDQTLNYLIGEKFWYIGSTSKWDRFWGENLEDYKAFKVLCLFISILLFSKDWIFKLLS